MESSKETNDLGKVKYIVSTEMLVDTFSFEWHLKNFSTLAHVDEILSPLFPGGAATNHIWQLIVVPKNTECNSPRRALGLNPTPTPFFSVRLCLFKIALPKPGQGQKVKAKFQISILNAEGFPGLRKATQGFLTFDSGQQKTSGLYTLINLADLQAETESAPKRLIVNDTVKLHCQISIQYELQHCSIYGGLTVETAKNAELRRLQELASDLQKGLETDAQTDVSLITKSKTFRAHKFVLMARSPVFMKMFSSPMIEASDNCVSIDDFDGDVVATMLQYIYTGKIKKDDNDNCNALELLRIADKYELLSLKQDCLEVLGNNLKIETALETLGLACLHNENRLKRHVMSFINRNKEAVVKLEVFKELTKSYPAIIMELYESN